MMPQSPVARQAGYRYLYRSDKQKFRYHIATESGSACKMENGSWMAKIDTISDSPPEGRILCQLCAQAKGLPTPVIPACQKIADALPPKPHVIQPAKAGSPDRLLATFGVSMSKHSVGFRETCIRVCQEQYERVFGAQFPGLTWEKARSSLGELKKRGVMPPPPGKPKLKAGKRMKSKAKHRSVIKQIVQPKRRKVAPEEYEYIISDAFLQSYEWRSLRYQVLKKNDGRCELCGMGKPHGLVLRVDHIKSRRLYPEFALDINNLQCMCEACNHGKGFRDKTDWRREPERCDSDVPWDRFDKF